MFRHTKGLLCFSNSWDNILLWSHYGNSHTGICLGFAVSEVHHIEVSYQPNLLAVGGPADINLEFVMRLLRTKYEVWSYEQELRIFVQMNDPPDENGRNWIPFGENLELKEVIVGAVASPEDSRKAIEICKEHPNVECAWACMRKDAFSLVGLNSPLPHLEWPVAGKS